MSSSSNRIALFIDGANLYATGKTLGFDIDYKRLLKEFQSRGTLLRAFYYTAIFEDQESRFRKSEQGDKWSFCLTAGKIGPRIRRDDEQTSTPEPHPGLQGEGGACRRQGRSNTGSTGGAVRRPPQSDHIVEGAA